MPAGTPVYAVADGEISFSDPMGGYGWLIIIDHPQANLYSLYGYLRPSRRRMEPGTVEKGELIDQSQGGVVSDEDVERVLGLLVDGVHVRLEGAGHDLGLSGWNVTPLLRAVTNFVESL